MFNKVNLTLFLVSDCLSSSKAEQYYNNVTIEIENIDPALDLRASYQNETRERIEFVYSQGENGKMFTKSWLINELGQQPFENKSVDVNNLGAEDYNFLAVSTVNKVFSNYRKLEGFFSV